MSDPPGPNVITIDEQAIEYRLERRGVEKVIEFLLCCQSCRGFLTDLRAPTDVTSVVEQPTLILATRNDGAVSFDHPLYLAATLPNSSLVEIDVPTHLLWLGEGSDRTASAIESFLKS